MTAAPALAPAAHDARLAALRAELAARGLDGFLVPLTDEHMSEYIPDCAQRLRWLTGFEGSAGSVVVLADRAAIFVDGRYTIQVMDQVSGDLFERVFLADQSPTEWFALASGAGVALGYDPRLHTPAQVEPWADAVAAKGGTLRAEADNPVDAVWTDRPARPQQPVTVHPERFAGRSPADKRGDIGAVLAARGADTLVLTMLDSVAWAFNIRGGDVVHNPVTLAYALIDADGRARLFIDDAKLDDAVRGHLGDQVSLSAYDDFYPALAALNGRRVLVDPASSPQAVVAALDTAGAQVVRASEPVQALKAIKNPVERDGARAAHLRDGVAMTRFLHWLTETAPAGGLDEVSVADRLAALRAEGEGLRGLSFDTISGAGPNGAMCHYRVTAETNRPLQPGELYLVDSGGQYDDGTTDITRTIAVSAPDATQRGHYTLVLKGYIALATTRFPRGTTGHQLDAIARRPLWQAGLDYDHGTGHGVGSYLNVHEGPQRIAKQANGVALEPGMIVSNEPGYYREGAYGIRLENLELVTEVADGPGEIDLLGFETLTLAPYDRRLIDAAALTADERAWVDAYHARVRAALSPHLPADTAAWLAEQTAPLD
ncbi:Xaa-Pro aminopeptidase [Rhodothalassium salexigens DSM 2132]|uniref:Xaa-Pro aminopeptidase n=1 Tax=Rhodothalassium salexigens DSM 2132 TaxID=1188247 RepID=A0A4R2PQB0_RHOSA|nr:aminopeptidase P family protein [Rhodothalassium salexigens]MBB4210941.1 Xaa-Pro aminopeptidase [Rhodothalassium salexigens DSM 2132]MBK1639809.1 X-Pro aminopeptidase [Rhodothalassium salexigens DSM 2132]TCP36401.1 Xaa-Pro aminopeptidase [Rhodothalassium salexigens DSM 2132]